MCGLTGAFDPNQLLGSDSIRQMVGEMTAAIVHRGRMTAVVSTQVINSTGRKALEVITTHARRP